MIGLQQIANAVQNVNASLYSHHDDAWHPLIASLDGARAKVTWLGITIWDSEDEEIYKSECRDKQHEYDILKHLKRECLDLVRSIRKETRYL